MNHLKDWLEECCVTDVTNVRLKCQSSVLYDSYRQFAERKRHRKVLDNRQFKSAMITEGFSHDADKKGSWYFGVALHSSESE
jgi:phage/plasmid-associated DNA primase